MGVFLRFLGSGGHKLSGVDGVRLFLSTLYHYFMCNILVFTSGVRYGKAKEISLVFLVSGMGLLFNLILMYVFVGLFALPGLLSKIAATCIVVVWNYLARKKWIF